MKPLKAQIQNHYCELEQEKAFNNIKQALTRAPALGLPSLKKKNIYLTRS